jgi:putative tryptophan/tyrosine transport system substrate-binding protein
VLSRLCFDDFPGIVPPMRWLFLLFSLLCSTPGMAAPRVAVVQSGDVSAYREPVPAFLQTLGEPATVVVIRGRQAEAEALVKRLDYTHPIVVFCLGAKAAWTVRRQLPNTPIVYAAVSDVERYGIDAPMVTGIRNYVDPVTYLSHFLGFFPSVKNIGILRGAGIASERSDALIAAGKEVGVNINIVEVAGPKEVRRSFVSMAPNIDAVWLQPDREILTRESYRLLTEEARRFRIPVLVDTYNMVRAGGLFAVVPNADGVGVLAAEMVKDILAGESLSEMDERAPRDLSVVVNMRTVSTSQIPFEPLLLDFVDIVVE